MNNKLRRLAEPGARLYLIILAMFAAATLFLTNWKVAAVEGAIVLLLIVYACVAKKRKEKALESYIEEVTYNTENAKNNTLMNFPLPICVFRMEDTRIVWGNEKFFEMCGNEGLRINACIHDVLPTFSGKWLLEGQHTYPNLLELYEKKYQVHGNIIRSEKDDENSGFMGIAYWIDVTGYENTRIEYNESRPVAGIIVFDNYEEIIKNETERIKNDIRDTLEDKLGSWAEHYHAIIKRYERDRYLIMLEKRHALALRENQFGIVEDVHSIVNSSGVNATLSIGLGMDGEGFSDVMQYASLAVELALSRGGDQAVIKNAVNYEFFGGRGYEIEKRTKVRSRVMASTLCELICDSSKVYVMGHRFSDYDCLGAAVGVCALARKCGIEAAIVAEKKHSAANSLIEILDQEPGMEKLFISSEYAMINADARTLLIVVDTSVPENVEDPALLESATKVAVIDHHRVGKSYINSAAFSFIEPYASSACELITELLEELTEKGDVSKTEADAILSGIVVDTKNFTLRTGERTFDAAAWLRRNGADTARVKKLMQNDMDSTVSRYKIMQEARLYKNIAIAVPNETPQRVVAAQAADELLNISGVEASVVLAPDGKGGVFASARSIGNLNVQILMEKLGGGGNRSAAAFSRDDCTVDMALKDLCGAIDDYFENK